MTGAGAAPHRELPLQQVWSLQASGANAMVGRAPSRSVVDTDDFARAGSRRTRGLVRRMAARKPAARVQRLRA
jgi:hypothetical protein